MFFTFASKWTAGSKNAAYSSTKLRKIIKLTNIPNTLFIGKFLIRLPEVDSTNIYAAQLLLSKTKPIDGTVVFTYRQTAGRGQYGSSWESEPDKNVALSLICYPSFLPAVRQFDLNKAVSLAVCDCIAALPGVPPEDVAIKWPNDLYIKDKKVAGILIQNTISGVGLQSSVIGIGLNVGQQMFQRAPKATSLTVATGRVYDLDDCLQRLCECLERRYLFLQGGDRVKTDADYLSHLYLYRRESLFRYPGGKRFMGVITGVDETGRLILETDEGEQRFGLKEIEFL